MDHLQTPFKTNTLPYLFEFPDQDLFEIDVPVSNEIKIGQVGSVIMNWMRLTEFSRIWMDFYAGGR